MLFPDRKWVEHKIDCNCNCLLHKEQFLIFCALVWMNKNKSISSKHRALHKQFSCVLKHALRYPKFVAVIKNNEQRTKMILEKSRLLIHKLSKWGQKMSISLPSSSDWHALMQFQKCRCHLAPNATKNARNLYWHLKMSTRNFGFYAKTESQIWAKRSSHSTLICNWDPPPMAKNVIEKTPLKRCRIINYTQEITLYGANAEMQKEQR